MPNNMELDRLHRPASSSSSTTTSDLLICFTSRLSHSSSMRISSKSILSPGHHNDNNNNKPPISLPNSLSRRMRNNNGSLKGGQSPMFPPGVTTKKRGCAFENPEPSSPKVTCIGQVRVKTKKQSKKMKMNMKAYTSRKTEEVRTTTICDALKDFSCFIPCRSSSCGGSGEGEKQSVSSSSSATCGGAVYRWLVAFNGEGHGRTRDIELVVEQEEEGEERVVMERDCSRRRSIFDDMDFNVDEGDGKEEGGRVSVCVPPKNALLLMRCRSDPVKMSALANKFWESPPIKEDDEEETEERRSGVHEDEKIESFLNFGGVVVCEDEVRRSCVREDEKIEAFSDSQVGREEEKRMSCVEEDEKIESFSDCEEIVEEQVEEMLDSVYDYGDEFVDFAMLFEEEEECGEASLPAQSTHQEEDPDEIPQTVVGKVSIFEQTELNNQLPPLESEGVVEKQSPISEEEEAMDRPMLPDCLLLMMCEPKLSMEVSEETWVCSTDFLRPWLPERHRQHQLKKLNAAGEDSKNQRSKKNRANPEFPPLPPLPARSSCSFPISMASLIEKKLVSAYEPFVLTRCKSEPMRSASEKLGPAPAPEMGCYWRKKKIEPANCGIGF